MQQQTNNMQMQQPQPEQPMQNMGQGGNMQMQQPQQPMEEQPTNAQPMEEQPTDAPQMEEGGQVVDEVTDDRLILNWGAVYTFFK